MVAMLRKGLPVLALLMALVLAAPQLVAAAGAQDPALLAEGERRQVIEFNPNAALQKRIFADGFVPNSSEFRLQVNGTNYAGQRAEHLRLGTVRVYYVAVGDWNDVRFAQRGGTGGSLAASLLAEGERRQVIQFNPNAALQKRIFADGFVPNSPEFRATVSGVSYASQRAENLGNGRVRVYYAVVGNWATVSYAQRGATTYQPSLSISPTRGPINTVIDIQATGFPANTALQVLAGPAEGGHAGVIARGRTNGQGQFYATGSISGIRSNRVAVRAVTTEGPAYEASARFNIVQGPVVDITPTSGRAGTRIQITAQNFPANTDVKVWVGPENSEGTQVGEGRTDANGTFSMEYRILGMNGTRWGVSVVAKGDIHAQSPWFTVGE